MSNGGLLQLVAYGEQDIILTTNPNITFFKLIYKKYINFAIKQYSNIFDSNIILGSNNNFVTINKDGDFLSKLVFKTSVKIENSNELGKFELTDNFAYSMIKKVQLMIGNFVINTLYGDWLNVWIELFVTKQKKKIIKELITKKNTKEFELYIPLPFFEEYNLALPIYTLTNNTEIKLKFEFRNKNTILSKQKYYFNNSNDITDNTDTNTQDFNLNINLNNSYIISDYILIDTLEKKKFTKDFNLLYEVNTYQEEILSLNSSIHRKELQLNNPTKFISFIIQPGSLINGGHYLANPGENFLEVACKRFCLKYCMTGYNNSKYGVLEDNSNNSLSGIGSKLYFNISLLSDPITNYENIFKNLFDKLEPKIIKFYGNDKINATTNNISVNIKNLNTEDKYLLSLPTSEHNILWNLGGNNNIISTPDFNNEGHNNYDYIVYDYVSYSNYHRSIIEKIGLELNSIRRIKDYNTEFFNYIEPIKYNLSANKNSIFTYSFSLNPKKHSPSGSCNFSNIQNFHIIINTKTNDNNINNLIFSPNTQIIKNNSKICFMSINYNILNITNGIVSLKYS